MKKSTRTCIFLEVRFFNLRLVPAEWSREAAAEKGFAEDLFVLLSVNFIFRRVSKN
jgi:hypothetical protein